MDRILLIKEMEDFIAALNQFLGSLNSSTDKECRLIIKRCGKKNRYYLKNADGELMYIPKSKMELIKQYARKEYEGNLELEAQNLIEALEKCVKILSSCKDPGEVYDCLSLERKTLVGDMKPFVNVEEWLARPYPKRKGFRYDDPQIKAVNGMYVRSKSEAMIVRVLIEMGIPFLYEFPIWIEGKWVFPDFRVLNVRTGVEYIYEHFGHMDDPDYVENQFLWKKEKYEEKGYTMDKNFVATYETKHLPLNEEALRAFIKRHFL